MNEQELNERRAEWAGWHWETAYLGNGMKFPILLAPNESLAEDQCGYIPDHTPDFPSDLNACFEWFEKPLVDHFIETTPNESAYRIAYYDFLCRWLVDYVKKEPHNPALAFCGTLDKLIDEIERKQATRVCKRCGETRTDDVDSDVCGSCADDTRQERLANEG